MAGVRADRDATVGDGRAVAGVRADRDAAVIVGARSGRSRGVAALRPYHAPARGATRRGGDALRRPYLVAVYRARDVYSLALFAVARPAGGPVRCLTLVTLSAVVEAFLGNSDCATAPLFPSGQMPSTGVAGLPGRRVGAQHRCAPTIYGRGVFGGDAPRGGATRRGGDAPRGGATHRVAPTIWSGGVFGGVAPLRRGVPLRPYNGCIRAGPVA